MIDIAHDLLLTLERADKTSEPGSRAEDRSVAAIMRRNGFSEQDIARTLGKPEASITDEDHEDTYSHRTPFTL